MKKLYIKIFLLLICTLSIFSTSYASNIGDYFKYADAHDIDPTSMKNQILGTLTYFGWGLAICVIIFVGIQFLTASTQKKAQLKEKLWLIILGIVILAGGVPLFRVFWNIFHEFRGDIINGL